MWGGCCAQTRHQVICASYSCVCVHTGPSCLPSTPGARWLPFCCANSVHPVRVQRRFPLIRLTRRFLFLRPPSSRWVGYGRFALIALSVLSLTSTIRSATQVFKKLPHFQRVHEHQYAAELQPQSEPSATISEMAALGGRSKRNISLRCQRRSHGEQAGV